MKITRRQLKRIIRESLPYRKGQPWVDPKAPVGVDRTEDDLDRELTDEEIEASMGMERAAPSGDSEFFLGYGDALDGKGLPVGASPDYKAGWEDGSLDRVTESLEGNRRSKYNAMSDAGHSMARRAKRMFNKQYPDIKVGLDSRNGWITVNGKKAVNMSQASGSPLSMEDVVDKMKQTYLGHTTNETKKLTAIKIHEIIRSAEALLNEEPADYYKNYKQGTITKAEYKELVRRFNSGEKLDPDLLKGAYVSSKEDREAMKGYIANLKTKKKWTGSSEELESRVHKYLIDIGFYLESHNGRVNPFSKGNHPDGGYTSAIPGVIKGAIASGEIDWATWEEIQPTYRKIDRSID